MIPTWPITLHTDLLRELLNFVHETGNADSADEVVAQAVKEWIRMRRLITGHTAVHDALDHRPDGRHRIGYQWKWLFLPEGTRVRIFRHWDHGEAVVVGSRFTFQGAASSPNQFACSAARGMRNAWRDLTLLFPGEKLWKLASARRREYRQACLAAGASPERRGQRMQRMTLADLHFDQER
jgi:hypothetical protein